jgi:hypothetical protein
MIHKILSLLGILLLTSCNKFDWHNPYDPECPKELFTPSSPGATMEGNSVKLTWSQQNDDISGFALFRSAEGESITNLTQTQKTTTQYIDASITPGKKYTYYVVAVAGTNKSDTVKTEIIPVIPVTISTGSVTEIAATSTKVSGNITNAGGGTVTSRGICWSTTPNPTVNSSKTTEGTGAGQFTSTLTNLLAGTTYYARAYGENSRGISYGTEISFTTLGPPKLSTTAVSNITATTATSGGTIISDGGSPITAKGVVWSTSPSPTIDLSTKTNDGTGVGSFTSTMSNLTINTKYYFRTYATNIVGTTYGEEFSFTTVNPITELLKQGLVAYYPFNGNANDESGNGNHAVSFNVTSTSDRFGKVNSAFKFNGIENSSSSQVNHVNPIFNIGQNEYTIHMYFKPDNLTQVTRCIFNSIPHTGIGVAFNDNNAPGYVVYDIGPANAFWTNLYLRGSKSNYQVGTWYSFTLIKSGINYRFYIDGVLEHTYSNPAANTYNFNVGFRISGITEPTIGFQTFAGDLDDFRLYNRALTQEEITYLAKN